jgi:hypothetical protein
MRICLYGGPGVGKSALASWLFSQIKMIRPTIDVELVSEYIKGWAWEKRVPISWDQLYIFGKQLHQEDKVLRHNVHIVSDSPLLLQIAYIQKQDNEFAQECLSLCSKFDKKYPALHIKLRRTVPYNPEGRYENLQQAIEMDSRITKLVNDVYGDQSVTFDPLEKELILDYVLRAL